MALCLNCGNENAYRYRIYQDKSMTCDRCANLGVFNGVQDVYFDGKPEINLADDPRTGKPIVFSSKSEKANYLRERGLMEAGDRHHGSFVSSLETKKTDSRPLVKQALADVMRMSPNQRHEAFLKLRDKRRSS